MDREPGFKSRKNKDGSVAFYWVAANAAPDAGGFPLKTVRLHGDDAAMAQRCRVLTSELRQWLAEKGRGPLPLFDGTVKGLIAVYRRTPESPYHAVKYSTRRMYDESLDLLERFVGARRLDKLTGLDFIRWYQNLKTPAKDGGPERVRRAYKAMQLVRIIVKFGVAANVEECFRLVTVLESLEFASPPKRTPAPTFAMIERFCKLVIEHGRRSLALAQAMQFELTLRQIDVIGEWEPDNGQGGIVSRGKRWSGGAGWNHISAAWVLTKRTTKTGQEAMHDITAYPFLHGLLLSVPPSERIGPIVVNEATGLPYERRQFAKLWRRFARLSGFPDSLLNRDSRAGGVTEGGDAGADIESLRHHANHADARTTSGYNRKTLEKTRSVAHLRVAHRSEK